MHKTEARKAEILSLLADRGKLSVSEIADAYNVSPPTVRRLCRELAEEGHVARVHGGIRHLPPVQTPYSYDLRAQERGAEKARIAQYASTLVQSGQVIFLEAGTTVRQLAVSLVERIRSGELSDMMVFTNSLINLEILYPVCRVNMIGGLYRHERRDFVGFLCERTVRGLSFDQCFMGADAVNISDGAMATDVETVRFDELLVSRSGQTNILAGSEKFGRHSLISFACLQDISQLVTDTKLPDPVLQEFRQAGVNVVCV